jgi:hypothetical protein
MPDALDVMDELAKIVELCRGYRARCEAAGFTAQGAEAMAVQLHGKLMAEMERRARGEEGS